MVNYIQLNKFNRIFYRNIIHLKQLPSSLNTISNGNIEKITINLEGKTKEISKGSKGIDLIPVNSKDKIIGCKLNNEFQSLRNPISHPNSSIDFIYKNQWKISEEKLDKQIQNSVFTTGGMVSICSLLNYCSFKDKVLLLDYGLNKESELFFIDVVYFGKEIKNRNLSLEELLKENKDDIQLNFNEEEIKELEKCNQYILDNGKLEEMGNVMDSEEIKKSIHNDNIYTNNNINNNGNVVRLLDHYYLINEPIINQVSSIKTIKIDSIELMHLPISGYETEQKRIRIYIKSFLSSKNEQEYEKQKEILKKRDHRYIGKQQQLYFSHKLSPGSTFFLPNGLFILKKLKNFIRNKYNLFNYQEVQTPLLFKKELFDISGHWQNYQKDMFQVSSCCGSHEGGEEDEITGLKPMNCPAHCLIFDSKPRMESDLPIRLADFGTLHRNEASGALTGLTRVRQFHQDDGHIFCTKEQINSEISSTLKMLKEVYTALELPNYDLTLSTRPTENFIGDIETWNSAETQLKQALDDTGLPWSVKEGDGAFYGPKIDIMIKDNYNRSHQTATIQLDFQLPSRFNLKYRTQENEWKTPVIVHRAIFGSLERIFAILIENYAGRWPFWLNPKQIIMLPFNDKEVIEYTEGKMKVLGKMYKQKYFSELKLNIDNSNKAISSKIKQAQIEQFNFMLVIGKEEMENETLTVRYRDGKIVKGVNMEQFVDLVFELNQPYL